MRFLILICVFLLTEYYAFQLFLFFFKDNSPSGKNISLGIYVTCTLIQLIFIILAMTGLNDSLPKQVNVIWGAMTFIIVLSKFIGGSFLLVDDLRRAILFIGTKLGMEHSFNTSRSKFLSLAALTVGSIPFLSLTYGMIKNPYNYKVFKIKLPIKNLAADLKGFKILQISDIHSGSFLFKEPVKRAIELINNEQADLVCFTGDLVNNKASEMDEFIDIFKQIESKNGVFSVLGNHDYGNYEAWPSQEDKKANFQRLKDVHKEMGWQLLLNENRKLQIGSSELAVIGVENQSASPRFPQKGDLPQAANNTEQVAFRLLLSHDPSHWNQEVTKSFKNIDLTLSGHTHGMQFGIEIPGFIKWSPIKYLYKQWAGLYKSEDQALYVNRGLGYLGYPGRVGIMPEITVIELV